MHKNNTKFIIHIIVMVVIYLIISNLTPVEPLTRTGLQVLAIVVAFVYGRITIDAVLPSFMALFMFATTGLNSIPGIFMAALPMEDRGFLHFLFCLLQQFRLCF